MPTFFHVDRMFRVNPSSELLLTEFKDINRPELQAHLDEMFPEGVSVHGDRYFLQSSMSPTLTDPNIEIFFEYVRRSSFPNKVSRYQSFFGSESIDDAIRFRTSHGTPLDRIWKVEADTFHRADMNLLTKQCSILVYSYFAHLYWMGKPGSANPIWEILMKPPIKIIQQVM